jgi:phosphatidylserine synthase
MTSGFSKKYMTFSIIVFAAVAILSFTIFKEDARTNIFANFLLFFILVYFSGIMLSKSTTVNNAKFFRNLTLSMLMKMLIGVAYFLLVISFIEVFKSNLVIFISSFFLAYLVFTIFEVIFLVGRFKELSKKAKEL